MPFFSSLPHDAGLGTLFEREPALREIVASFKRIIDASPLEPRTSQLIAAYVDAARQAGRSEREIQDTLLAASFYAFVNRLVDGNGLRWTPERMLRAGQDIARQLGGGGTVTT